MEQRAAAGAAAMSALLPIRHRLDRWRGYQQTRAFRPSQLPPWCSAGGIKQLATLTPDWRAPLWPAARPRRPRGGRGGRLRGALYSRTAVTTLNSQSASTSISLASTPQTRSPGRSMMAMPATVPQPHSLGSSGAPFAGKSTTTGAGRGRKGRAAASARTTFATLNKKLARTSASEGWTENRRSPG